MKVKELIKQLEHHNNPDDEVIADVWSKADDDWIENISDKHWKKLVNKFDGYDYSDEIHNQLIEIMEEE